MSWTRLKGTDIWDKAKARYDGDPWRRYHVFDHVERLYHHAEHSFGLAYDVDLDRAILAHDVVSDAHPEKELRSAQWLMKEDPAATEAAFDQIMRTADHGLSEDNRIVLLDLADFMFFDYCGRNFQLNAEEAQALHGTSMLEFSKQSFHFLSGLRRSLTPDIAPPLAPWEKDALERIRTGIDFTLRIARMKLQYLDPDGLSARGCPIERRA